MSGIANRRTGVRRWLALAATAVVVGMTGAASAQFGEAAGFANMMRQDYLRRDLQLISQGLDLDEGQRVIVESFYEDYTDNFNEAVENMRERFRNMRGELQTQDREQVMRVVFEPLKELQAEKQRLHDAFESNIKLILNDRQLDQWQAFKKMMLREKQLPQGKFDGENVNLLHVVRDLNLAKPEKEAIQDVLDQYEQQLHQALQQRKQMFEDRQRRGKVIAAMQGESPQEGLKIIKEQIAARKSVRNVNLQYIDVIAEAMPTSTLAEQFREDARARAFPRVYHKLSEERIFDAALQLEDLDTETRDAVVDLANAMNADLESVRTELEQQIKTYEPASEINQAERYIARLTDDNTVEPMDNPVQPLIREMHQSAREYALQLRDLLTPEVFDQLPGASRIARSVDPEIKRERIERAREVKRRQLRSRGRAGDADKLRSGAGGASSGRDARQRQRERGGKDGRGSGGNSDR